MALPPKNSPHMSLCFFFFLNYLEIMKCLGFKGHGVCVAGGPQGCDQVKTQPGAAIAGFLSSCKKKFKSQTDAV